MLRVSPPSSKDAQHARHNTHIPSCPVLSTAGSSNNNNTVTRSCTSVRDAHRRARVACMQVEQGCVGIFGVAALSMLVPIVSSDFNVVLSAFLVLEACIGASFGVSSSSSSSLSFPSDPCP
eukprot:771990-Rhodomonas_salina.1